VKRLAPVRGVEVPVDGGPGDAELGGDLGDGVAAFPVLPSFIVSSTTPSPTISVAGTPASSTSPKTRLTSSPSQHEPPTVCPALPVEQSIPDSAECLQAPVGPVVQFFCFGHRAGTEEAWGAVRGGAIRIRSSSLGEDPNRPAPDRLI
jgi:hypothetical protein